MSTSPSTDTIKYRLQQILKKIRDAEQRFNRTPNSVQLLAVSKTFPVVAVQEAIDAGQTCFGENYLQDALVKLDALHEHTLEWHFIGPIQSNKTRVIASRFDWVHSIDRLKIARRLSEQRPETLPALNLCLQININLEASKSGIDKHRISELALQIAALPNVRLRGLMAIPEKTRDFATQRRNFAAIRHVFDELNQQGLQLDTLSMGMSDDMDAAIAEGATIIRIGTAIFGSR